MAGFIQGKEGSLIIEKVVFYEQTDLNIDGANGNFIQANIGNNQSLTLLNIVSGIPYYILITNNSASVITIALPNTADIKAANYFEIGVGKSREVAMIYNGVKRIWQVSEELA